MSSSVSTAEDQPQATDWRAIVDPYRRRSLTRSLWQLVNSLVPYLVLLALMVWSLQGSYLVTLLLGIPAAGLAVRLFIISHDCGHGSFFETRRWNDFWGVVTSFLLLTPYAYWRREHARHHATSGNLDHRGTGDIWTLTIDEYRALSRFHRLRYRLYRNPLVLFGVGPLFLFAVRYRLWDDWAGRRDRLSVLRTNLMLALLLAVMHWTIGLRAYLMVQVPVLALAAGAGVWLFYVQHQFEEVYWAPANTWDFYTQAIEGSSCYELPRVLQWFTGNIGYHHVHHLCPSIPNYRLEKCHRENQIFQRAGKLTLLTSLKSAMFRLWDPRTRRMVGFDALHAPESEAAGAAQYS